MASGIYSSPRAKDRKWHNKCLQHGWRNLSKTRGFSRDLLRNFQLDVEELHPVSIFIIFPLFLDYRSGLIHPGDPYMRAIQEPNVDVHFTAVNKITEDSVIDTEGTEKKVDTIICATGFDVSYKP